MIVDVLIPARDEAGSIGAVIASVPAGVRRVVVVDGDSRDATAEVARGAGATVVTEPRRGYGTACLAGIEHLAATAPPDVVVFLDADGADDPREIPQLLAPIERGAADMVLGSRTLGAAEPGALTPQQRVGNAAAVALIHAACRHRYSDLGPFRAIRFDCLRALGMRERGYGWPVEMQLKAVRRGLRVLEVPVRCRRRTAGRSKVSGTLLGTVGAGARILLTIARLLLER